ncbi:hypothetical protein ABHN98_00360 [Pseudomonas syringae]
MASDEALPESQPASDNGVLAIDPLYIPGQIPEIHDADGTPNPDRVGVNRSMITSNAKGLLVDVFSYLNSKAGDNIRIYTSLNPGTPLLSFNLQAGQENEISHVFIPAHLLLMGFQTIWYVIIRNSNNWGESVHLPVFIRILTPGGTDPRPDSPGHYRLLAPTLLNVPAGGVTLELAQSEKGVQLSIPAYLNMRPWDVIPFFWGGHVFYVTVLPEQVGRSIVTKVPPEVIIAAGNGDQIVTYRPLDEVHNNASDHSLRTSVYVEVVGGFLRAVILEAVQVDSATGELFYDLSVVGTKDIQCDVVTRPPTFAVGDTVELNVSWIKDGTEIAIFTKAGVVTQIDSTVRFFLPNNTFTSLAREHIYFRYKLIKKSDGSVQHSSRTTVWLAGTAVNLRAPKILPINGVELDPKKAATGIVSPDPAITAMAWVHFFAHGTAPGGAVKLFDSGRRISSSQVSRDMTYPLPLAFISGLDGGQLDGYYTVGSAKDDPLAAKSLVHSVRVGEPKPDLRAAVVVDAVDGVLDPDQLPPFADAEVQVLPFNNMKGHTVFLWWQSDNPLDSQRYEDSIEIDDRDLDIPVSFYLFIDWLKEQLGFKVTIRYSVEPSDGSGPERFGAETQVQIGAGAGKLLDKPEAKEADENGVVIPSDTALNGLSIVVANANLQSGDHFYLIFDGGAPNGDYYYDRPISGSGAGKPFTHQVPYSFILANQDFAVSVRYRIERALGGEESSDVLLLSVQRAVLPVIRMAQAKGPNLDSINLDDVPAAGGSAIIYKTAQLKSGDVVKIILSNNPTPISKTVGATDVGLDLTVRIAHSYFAQHNGSSFTASYSIARATGGPDEPSAFKSFSVQRDIGSGKFKVMGARHNSNTYRSSSLSCRLVALDSQTLAPKLVEWRYAGDIAWTAGNDFIDTDSGRELTVRSTTDTVDLNPVNMCGNGLDANTSGAASIAVLRDPRVSPGGVVGGRDLSAAGHPSYGGAVPANLLIQENLKALHCTGGAYAILTDKNNIEAWGEASGGGNLGAVNPSGIKELASNSYAFAALDLNGSVRCWGQAPYGGTLPAGGLSNISKVYNGGLAFVARRNDGSLTGWGLVAAGGVANPAPGITNPKRLICSYQAFAGITQTNRLFAFGAATHGGNALSVASRTDIDRLCCANARAFVALSVTKNAVVWGDATYGGALPPAIATLRFVDVVSTWHAFAGVTENNRVAAWGPSPAGVVPANIAALTNVITIAGTSHAFAVLCADGKVYAWGNATLGGDTSAVSGQLFNVVALYTNSHCFFALTSDNRVVSWGNATALSGSAVFNGFVSHLKS